MLNTEVIIGIRKGQNRIGAVLGLKFSQDFDGVALEQVGRDFVLQFNADADGNMLECVACDRFALAQYINLPAK